MHLHGYDQTAMLTGQGMSRHLALKNGWLGSCEVLVSMPELAKFQKSLQDFPPRQKGAGTGAPTLSVRRN